ncbi:MAG: type I-E CRISPR-associated protein Cas7/Cse4/CasC [Firmicutes bacterium]|uniref:Type I-E CRISPR-associated protein Cas7/Cse4/CasC n=1 Tax=Geochorda subterranea TaxID=3109564 RepID=A0ABZ1BQ97_9FIRM|nr:type I-E CRISPR-associated protein Cas7/Cse4/CasC [Limnochorda sp. LNt]NLG68440.1 type I-E CRISPR-associated protein Cas7/Cse4/CasC [Bacillota bacterium]WRP14979.1 type I-E CRISPR-associated protein Cas7/Cse4/CasC [Limnochorda sp. LNt]
MFLQIHFLTSYHASLLNRDDAGLAKRIIFGGYPRLRVSSQCQKRHWRQWMMEHTRLPAGIRSRHFFARIVKGRLIEQGMQEDVAHALTFHLAQGVLKAAGEKEAVDRDRLEMKQPVLFGQPEADYFVTLIQEAAREGSVEKAKAYLDARIKAEKNNFKALLDQAGIRNPVAGFEGALFGRFVTSDVLARVDAPVHVGHAFTTHALETEVDFFTAVDDLAADEETGAAHAGDMEIGAGIFYGYVVVDIPLLVSNLTGCRRHEWQAQDRGDARALLDLLIQAIAQVTPGAKLGATAPYARAECVVLEVGTTQPRSLANAFLKPVSLGHHDGHPMAQSVEAMAKYLNALESMYGDSEERRFVSCAHPWPRDREPVVPLREAIRQSLDHALGDAP